jgi:hypothetical protein
MKKYRDHTEVKESQFYTSTAKCRIRKSLLDYFVGNPKNIFTFSGIKAMDVYAFSIKNAHIISIEENREIWEAQSLKHRKINTQYLWYEFKDWVKQGNHFNPFDIYYLDFNRIWSVDFENEINDFFALNMKRDSIIGITVVAARESLAEIEKTQCFQMTCAGNPKSFFENRANVISVTIQNIAKKCGKTLKLLNQESMNYIASKCPMLFMAYKIVKV